MYASYVTAFIFAFKCIQVAVFYVEEMIFMNLL